jgi:antitoxin VapB
MTIGVRNSEAETAVRELAARLGVSLAEAIRISVINELRRMDRETVPLAERVKKLQAHLASYPKTGLKADKSFFDDLSGDQ